MLIACGFPNLTATLSSSSGCCSKVEGVWDYRTRLASSGNLIMWSRLCVLLYDLTLCVSNLLISFIYSWSELQSCQISLFLLYSPELILLYSCFSVEFRSEVIILIVELVIILLFFYRLNLFPGSLFMTLSKKLIWTFEQGFGKRSLKQKLVNRSWSWWIFSWQSITKCLSVVVLKISAMALLY